MVTYCTTVQRLESRCLVTRLAHPDDARSSPVLLTVTGLDLVDRSEAAHVANEHRLLSPLKAADLAALQHRLSLLQALEPDRRSPTAPPRHRRAAATMEHCPPH